MVKLVPKINDKNKIKKREKNCFNMSITIKYKTDIESLIIKKTL